MLERKAWVRSAAAATVVAASAALALVAAAGSPHGFTASVERPRPTDLRFSHRPGCPVGPAELRLVRLAHWGFDGRRHVGALVVHRRVARDVVGIFRRLYGSRFPIRRLEPVSRYRGSDDASMAADNTSGFNCRRVASASSGSWSMHAYGLAVDVNPVENPYVVDGRARPAAGARYVRRTPYRAGMAVEDGVLVRAFEAAGWRWGGRWTGTPDYQHFSTTGR